MRGLARDSETTLFCWVRAALELELADRIGTTSFVLGSPASSRPAGFERTVGNFANLIPLVSCVGRNATAEALIASVTEDTYGAIEHGSLPYLEIRRCAELPPIQIALAWNRSAPTTTRAPVRSQARTPFELMVIGFEGASEATIQVESSSGVSREFLDGLLEGVCARALDAALGMKTRRRVASRPQPPPPSSNGAWTDRLFEMVRAVPERTAASSQEQSLSYGELWERAQATCAALVASGGGPGDLVAIDGSPSPRLLGDIIGIQLAGAAYLPIDPSWPPSRKTMVLEDAGPRFSLEDGIIRTTRCEDRSPFRSRAAGVHPWSRAYVMYTSGSTGRPKGVAVEHGALASFLEAIGRRIAIEWPATLLSVTPTTFDISILEMLLPLCHGGRVHFASRDVARDGRRLVEELGNVGASVMQATPMTWRAVLEAGWTAPASFVGLCGGEAMAPDLRDRLLASGGTHWNVYGPTEATVWVSAWRVETGPVVVGRALDNCELVVLDDTLELVPQGQSGQVAVAGQALARGYLNRAELTARRFVPYAAGGPGQRVYLTGDLGRVRPDGTLEVLGRMDTQVKLRGHRIELGEIETVARRELPVMDSAATLTAGGLDAELVLHLVAPGDGGLTLERVRSALSPFLPEVMLPTRVRTYGAFPRNVNGKLDRRALSQDVVHSSGESSLPQTLEQKICRLWERILNRAAIGQDDDFFAHGGHSLLGVRMLVQLRQQLEEGDQGQSWPLCLVIDNRSPRALARAIRSRLREQRAVCSPLRVDQQQPSREECRRVVPLSGEQRSMLAAIERDPSSPAYNLAYAADLAGPVDLDRLHGALREVMTRHDALRFARGDDGFVVCEQPKVSLHVLEEPRARSELLETLVSSPLSAEHDQWLHASVIRDSSTNRDSLLLVLHHLICDGVSGLKIWRGLLDAYDGERGPARGEAPSYALLSTRRSREVEASREQHLKYWRKLLVPARCRLDICVSDDVGEQSRGSAGTAHVRLSSDASAGLARLVEATAGTVFSTILGALGVVLSALTGGEDELAVVVPVSQRRHEEALDCVGMMLESVLVRLSPRREASVEAYLRECATRLLEAREHAGVALADIVEACRGSAARPNVCIAWIPEDPVVLSSASLGQVTVRALHPGAAKFDLTFFVREGQEAVELAAEWKADRLRSGFVESCLALVSRLLSAAAHTGDVRRPVRSWLEPAESVSALGDKGGDDADVVELFRAAASRHPTQVAVVDGDRSVTYAELDAQSDRLAARMLELVGPRPELVVGIALERSLEFVRAVVAAGKAGLAWMPTDLEDPRSIGALRKADCRLLISSGDPAIGVPCLDPATTSGDEDTDTRPRPARAAHPEDLAYIITTSGTTGDPKLVGVTRGGLANHTAWMQSDFRLSPGTRVLFRTSTVFDASVWELWSPLSHGATLVVATASATTDPGKLLDLVSRHGVEVMQVVPSLLRPILEGARQGELESLTRLFCGGEELCREDILALRRICDAEVVNLYGPSEFTIDATFHRLRDGQSGAVPIGRPIDGVEAMVVDRDLQQVHEGGLGELYLAGKGMARGYLGAASETAASFVPNPWGPPGSRMYRTGDIVARRPGGQLVWRGRRDQQAKVNGVRVELGEVRRALSCHDDVVDAQVVVTRIKGRGERLSACVMMREGATLDEHALKDHVARSLPLRLVPAMIRAVTDFPRLVSGKVDARALRQALSSPEPRPGPAREPQSPEPFRLRPSSPEGIVSEVVASVLRRESFGADEDFIAAGGDSISALRVVALLRRRGISASSSVVLRARTPRKIASMSRPVDPQTPRALASGEQDRCELSPIQNWLFCNVSEDRGSWSQGVRVSISSRHTRDSIESALRALIARHPMLRTGFRAERETPEMVQLPASVSRDFRLSWNVGEELSSLRSFDLSRPPLIRAWVDDIDGALERRLSMVAHHLVVDPISWSLIVGELDELLAGRELPALHGPTYFEWVRALKAEPLRSRLRGQFRFWSQRSVEAERFSGSREGELRTVLHEVVLHPEVSARTVRDHALALLIHCAALQSEQRWIGVDVESHARAGVEDLPECDSTVGWFTSIHPIRIRKDTALRMETCVAGVTAELKSTPDAGLGHLWLSQQYWGTARSGQPLLFNYLGAVERPELARFRFIDDTRSPRNEHPHALELECWTEGNRLCLRWRFDPKLRPETQSIVASAQGRLESWFDREALAAGGLNRPR